MIKKILITGASGSGGSYLAEHIVKKKVLVYGVIRNKRKIKTYNLKNLVKNKYFKILDCKLSDVQKLKIALQKINPQIIFHLASNADVQLSFKKPFEIIKENNLCTLSLLEAVRISKIKTKILICSTSEVYGNVPGSLQPIKENCNYNPINPYAVSKTFQDLVSQNYNKLYGINIVITRMFTYLNARRRNLFASAFAHQVVEIENKKNKKNKNYLVHGKLNSLRAILDIRDAMEAYWLAAKKGKNGEIYNISGDFKITVRNFLKHLINKSEKKIILKANKKLFRPKDINSQIANCSKFKRHTGWKPKYKFEQSLDFLLTECRKIYNERKRK